MSWTVRTRWRGHLPHILDCTNIWMKNLRILIQFRYLQKYRLDFQSLEPVVSDPSQTNG